MSSQICRAASRSARTLLPASRNSVLFSQGRTVAAASAASFRGKMSTLASVYQQKEARSTLSGWLSGALVLPAAAYMLQDQPAEAAEMERTFILIKPDGVQRGLIGEIIARFERKGFKLVAIRLVIPTKSIAEEHCRKNRIKGSSFNSLSNFLCSGPVLAMVWEGEAVVRYSQKLIGNNDPQRSEPGTIVGDLAVLPERNVIHGSSDPRTAKDEISLWFNQEELPSYTSNTEN
ncbi:nucleoside diphosphate kinase IV, chloroplastic/mitochondrial-like isoform X1 [Nymphaea colorata]|nr:nucleoside diphosphate kinase IV, chloroplastic/mitochondrial-like isoform X1 [Nymphaea colorata]